MDCKLNKQTKSLHSEHHTSGTDMKRFIKTWIHLSFNQSNLRLSILIHNNHQQRNKALKILKIKSPLQSSDLVTKT